MGIRCVGLFLVGVLVFSASFVEAATCRIVLGSMNGENIHDPQLDRAFPGTDEFTGVNDREQLGLVNPAGSAGRPFFDWNWHKFDLKVGQLLTVLGLMPREPDLLSMVEVANGRATSKVSDGLGYDEWWTTESQGERGMDVGLLAKHSPYYRVLRYHQHRIGGLEFEHRKTRNILVVTLLVQEKYILHVLVNHWPSQAAQELGNDLRTQAALELRNLVARLVYIDFPGSQAIALGDFNTLEEEKDSKGHHPFRDILEMEHGPATLVDLSKEDEFRATRPKQPDGTYFYPPDESWNMLDRIFVTRGLLDPSQPIRIKPGTFQIHGSKKISRPYTLKNGKKIWIPWRYNWWATTPEDAGFTDHYPVSVVIEADEPEVVTTPSITFDLDKDILLLENPKRVILYSKKSGRRKFISWEEYEANKEAIEKGKYGSGIWELREDSFSEFEDKAPDLLNKPRNKHYDTLRRKLRLDPEGEWRGPKWDEFVEALSSPETRYRVRIKSERKIPREWVRQSLVYLWKEDLIKYIPKVERIRTKFEIGQDS